MEGEAGLSSFGRGRRLLIEIYRYTFLSFLQILEEHSYLGPIRLVLALHISSSSTLPCLDHVRRNPGNYADQIDWRE